MADKDAQSSPQDAATQRQRQQEARSRSLQQEYWRTNGERIRGRNRLLGLAIGAFVVGIFSYTILSVRQEKIMDEIDNEAKVWKGPRTGANS